MKATVMMGRRYLLPLLAVIAATGVSVAQDWDTYDWSNYDWSLETIELGTPTMTTDESIADAQQAAAESPMQMTLSAVGFDIPAGSTAEQYLQVVSEAGGGSYYRAEAGGGLARIMDDAATGRAPTPQTPAPTAGELVICREVVNGAPVGVGTAFNAVPEVTLFHSYRGQAAGQAEAIWFRDGAELTRSTTQIQGGDGYAWFTLRGGGGGMLPDGRYEVALTMPGRPAVLTSFTIGQPATTAAPAPAPAPPAPTTGGMPGDMGGLQVGTANDGPTVIGAADHFDRTDGVAAAMNYENLPHGATAVAVWTQNGNEIARSQREVGGSGWVSFSLSTGTGQDMPPGVYTLTITVDNRVIGRKTFTIGGGVG